MSIERRTPWEIAVAWYDEAGIVRAIHESGTGEFGAWDKIPSDVTSAAFAKWLTHQYRLAMAKGIQLGRDGSEDQVKQQHSTQGGN